MPIAAPVGAAIVTGIAGLAGAGAASSANKSAAKLNEDAQTHAANLQAQAARDALAFQQQQSTLAQKNYADTNAFNRSVYTDQQQRLTPYRALGAGSLAQLSQPIPGGR